METGNRKWRFPRGKRVSSHVGAATKKSIGSSQNASFYDLLSLQ